LNVLIDGIVYSLQASGGVSVYFSELIRFLARQPTVRLDVGLFRPCIAQGIDDIRSAPWTRHQASRWQERYRACQLTAPADVFHSTYYRRPADARVPTVVTVHDFYYERFRQGLAKWVHSRQKFSAIRAAQAIVCVSQATADDLQTFVGLRPGQTLQVIPNGVGAAFVPLPGAAHDPQQLLFVGGRGGYKNFALVLQALRQLPAHQLVCVGGGPLRAEEFAGVPASVRARVRHLAYVSDDTLASLYQHSLALLYPSSFEGFGIPVAEAMKCGCPVIGLRACAAVREVAGDALMGLDGEDPAPLAAAVETLMEPAARAKITRLGLEQAAPLNWQATHERTLQVYQSLLEHTASA
jgi:mannosyltransferase